MADVIMEYDLMRAMVKILRDAEDNLFTCFAELNFAVKDVESENFIQGDTATRMVAYIKEVLIFLADDLHLRIVDLAANVDGARAAIEDGDMRAASRFH